MLRVGMLSFAHVHADVYARQVMEHAEADLQCIWDDNLERGRAAAERYSVSFTDELTEVVESDEIDAVVVNTETIKHKQMFMAAIAAGKHIFTEKALTIKTSDADDVVNAVHESGIKFMISLPSRTSPGTLFMKKVLDEGLLGQVTLMRARVAHDAALDRWFTKPRHKGRYTWFSDPKLAGGGALFDLGCHTMDVMRWFLGEPDSVIAKIQTFSGACEVDDNSAVVVEFKNKALGILDSSFMHRVGPNPMEIYGTEGYVAQGLPGQGLVIESTKLKDEGIRGPIPPRNLPDPLPSPMEQWISAILHDTPMTITVEDGRNLTELLEVVYRSAREGRELYLG